MAWNDVTYAAEMIKRLEKYNLSWVEEPLMPNNHEGYKLLKSKVGVNLAAGEHEFTKFGAKDLIINKIVDIIQLNTRRMGGITEAKKVASLAETFGVEFAPHIAYPETIHLTLSCPGIKWAEVTAVPSWEKKKGDLSGEYLKGMPAVENGFIKPDYQKPGLGIELDMDIIDSIRIN